MLYTIVKSLNKLSKIFQFQLGKATQDLLPFQGGDFRESLSSLSQQ